MILTWNGAVVTLFVARLIVVNMRIATTCRGVLTYSNSETNVFGDGEVVERRVRPHVATPEATRYGTTEL